MYCRKCGSWLPDDSNFCNYCGKETKHAKKKKTIPILLILLIAFTGITIFSSKYLIKTLFPAPLNYDELAQAVVKINCYDASGKEYKTGSGVVFPYNNVIVTNYHVVGDEAFTFEVLTDQGDTIPIRSVIAFDEQKDLAVLELAHATDITPMVLGDSSKLKRGNKISTIGSPLGLINMVSDGVISGFVQEDGNTRIQFTATISNGSSGGALLNSRGELIGIVTSHFQDGNNMNVAIPAYEIDKVLASGKVNMNLIDFYNLREHQILTYTVTELYDKKESLTGKKITVFGEIFDSRTEGAYIKAPESSDTTSRIFIDFSYSKKQESLPKGTIVYVTGLFFNTSGGPTLYADNFEMK